MRLTIGYTIWNKKGMIPSIITGISQAIDENDEVIFLFDNCGDGSFEELKRLEFLLKVKPIIITSQGDLYETKANNQILARSTGDFVALFQDDIVLRDPLFKNKVLAVSEKYGDKLGVIGGRTGFELTGERSYPENTYYRVSNWEHLDKQYRTKLKEGESIQRTVLNRGPLIFPRQTLNTVGFLDEEYYPMIWDDADYCIKTRIEYGKTNVVMQCNVESQLKWGATHNKESNVNLRVVGKANWDKLMDRWSDKLKENYENLIEFEH